MHENPVIPRPALVVGALSLLPFPALLGVIWLASPAQARQAFTVVLLTYMAAVLALMGGANWALATGPYGRSRIAAEWLTGLACLIIAWASLNMEASLGMTMLVAAFFLLALRDVLIAEAAGMLQWLATLRLYIAVAAIVTAILTLVRIVI